MSQTCEPRAIKVLIKSALKHNRKKSFILFKCEKCKLCFLVFPPPHTVNTKDEIFHIVSKTCWTNILTALMLISLETGFEDHIEFDIGKCARIRVLESLEAKYRSLVIRLIRNSGSNIRVLNLCCCMVFKHKGLKISVSFYSWEVSGYSSSSPIWMTLSYGWMPEVHWRALEAHDKFVMGKWV